MDLVALSHLRWDFVYQRPQHLLSRAARRHRVLFVEEPVEAEAFALPSREVLPNLSVVAPTVPHGTDPAAIEAWLAEGLPRLVRGWRRGELAVWHYAVMAEPVTRGLDAAIVVYDCMDELSLFRGAPPDLVERERALLGRADLVFTGGHSLWEAKRDLHPSVHAFPSSVDVQHFSRARREQEEPAALHGIPHPRLVYAGVIDERIDLPLLASVAASGVGEVVLVGPTAKIDPDDVPSGPGIHRLGMQPYEALPALFSHASVGLMPFALNEATRFISPTKTPEYLAAGLPVVSTPIRDVVRGYAGLADTVRIADGTRAFAEACEDLVRRRPSMDEADRVLATMSWDTTWEAMERLMEQATHGRDAA